MTFVFARASETMIRCRTEPTSSIMERVLGIRLRRQTHTTNYAIATRQGSLALGKSFFVFAHRNPLEMNKVSPGSLLHVATFTSAACIVHNCHPSRRATSEDHVITFDFI
jgi:hypothetical protein